MQLSAGRPRDSLRDALASPRQEALNYIRKLTPSDRALMEQLFTPNLSTQNYQ